MPHTFVHWRALGSVHRARWMAKLIYSVKIYLFHTQDVVKLTKKEKLQLERLFSGIIVYQVMNICSQATEALHKTYSSDTTSKHMSKLTHKLELLQDKL